MGENNETAARVIRQLEYYFGDANLYLDKFLSRLIREREDGWIPLDILVTFNRLSDVSTDTAFIANCVANSNSNLIEVNDERNCVRRKQSRPILERNADTQKLLDARTVYVEGIPKTATLDNIIAYMEANYGPTDRITMVKDKVRSTEPEQGTLPRTVRKFTGSAFVCFKNREDQAKILADQHPVFAGNVLRKMTALEHKAKTKEQRKQAKIAHQVRSAKGTLLQLSELPPALPLTDLSSMLSTLKWNVAFIKPLAGTGDSVILRMSDVTSAAHAMERVRGMRNGRLNIHGTDVKVSLLAGDPEEKVLDALLRDKMKQSGFSSIKKRLRKIALHAEGKAENSDSSDTDDDEMLDMNAVVDNQVLFVPMRNGPPSPAVLMEVDEDDATSE